jgi:PTH2 family peptidyl-tRNA hydrolase
VNAKQVIVMRKDLKMRRGKEIAQGAHAAMAWLTNTIKLHGFEQYNDDHIGYAHLTGVQRAWVEGLFTKVCLQVNSEDELMAVHDAAVAAKLTVSLITDAGKTEFGGVPTRTCLAIGPDLAEDIDKVTSQLKLY